MRTMPTKYTILFSLNILLCFFFEARAQDVSIRLTLSEHKNDTVLFAHYYNGNIVVNDTLVTDQSGKAMIKSSQLFPQGIYTLWFNGQKQIDFLIGKNQQISIGEKHGNIEVTGSLESVRFQDYLYFLNEKKKQAAELQHRIKLLSDPDSVSTLKQQLHKLDEEVQTHWQQEAKTAAGTFYGKFVASNIRTSIDEDKIPAEILSNDSLKWAYTYIFNKNHYWDHFDLYNIRMWRTPVVHKRLDEYFNKILLQTADSVLPAAVQLIEASENQPEIFQNLVSFVLNNSVKSAYMDMENVFVAIAEKYYLTGKAFWASDKTIENIRQEVYFRKNNLLGTTAKELLLEDENGDYHSLHQQQTPFTLVVFWEPNCGHCKTQLPALFEEVFLKTDPSKLTIMAVCTQENREEWLSFIGEYGLNGWINVWDPHQTSNFRVNYNVRTTPMIYLLDKNKQILAKKLSVEQVKKIFEELVNAAG